MKLSPGMPGEPTSGIRTAASAASAAGGTHVPILSTWRGRACSLALLFSPFLIPASAHEENSVEIGRLTERIAATPGDPMLYVRRAEMHRLTRHWHAAEKDYQRAAELDPGLALVDLAFGAMWNDANQPERALPLLDRYLGREPANSEGYAERARTRRMLRHWPAAAADHADAVENAPAPEPGLFADWADTLRESGDPAGALAALNRGIADLGQVISLEVKALELEEAMQRHDAALERIESMLARPGRKDSLLSRKAAVLIAAGRTREARACAALARREFNAVPEARRLTGAGRKLDREIADLEARTAGP